MNPNTPPPSDDDLPDEQELRARYARLPKVEPDASLDAAILARATRATPVRRRPRWPVAFGSAAVLVLAVGVAWQVRDTSPLTVRPEAAPAAAPTDAGVAGTLAEPAKPSMKASAVAPAPRRTVHSARVATETPVSSFAPVATPAPAPAPPPVEAEMAPVPAPAPVPPAPPAPPAPAAPAEPAPANAFHYTGGNPSAPISEGLIAPGPKPVPGEARKVDAARQAKVEAIFKALDATDAKTQQRSTADLPPDDRIGDIRRLLNQGQRDEAMRQLRDFRRRYPHYDLPQDLRDLNP